LSVNPQIQTVADAGERALIERIRVRAGQPSRWITTGIGDDAAVMTMNRGEVVVATADSLVEDVHFRRSWTAPRAIGQKAVAVNFSDLAAMGAAPRAVLLSLMLPPDTPLADFDAMVDGVVAECEAHGASLAGGNITSSPRVLAIDVTALGGVHPRRTLTRSGGRPGDELYLTGSIGAAATGLALLEGSVDRGTLADDLADCLRRYEAPIAHVRCGRSVAGNRAANACMDLSDGLADAARQMAQASRTGVVLEGKQLPIHAAARAWSERSGADPVASALIGGEDYELLFAVPAKRRRGFLAAVKRAQVETTRIGSLTADSRMRWVRGDDSFELPGGYAHFG